MQGGNRPSDAHHHGNDYGDLHGPDDGGDEDVVQLLAAGDHIQDVEVLGLVALGALVTSVTPGETHTTQVIWPHTKTRTHTHRKTYERERERQLGRESLRKRERDSQAEIMRGS